METNGDDAPPREVADEDQDEELGEPDVFGGVGDEGARKPRIGRRPILPMKAGVMEHFPMHLQYRSWCRHCSAGKGRPEPHILVLKVGPSQKGSVSQILFKNCRCLC